MNFMKTPISRRAAWLLLGILGACGGGGGGGGTGSMMTGPMAGYVATDLVTDVPLSTYASGHTDSHLVNAWGLAFNPQGFAWVANNGTASLTVYDGNGVQQSTIVTTPPKPTGLVFNASGDFMVGGSSSQFILATTGGLLAAWATGMSQNIAQTVYDGSASGSNFKGLAIGAVGASNYLFAADFHNNAVAIFNGSFQPVAAAGTFKDPSMPAGYAPFGIQAIGNHIYVAYAMQDSQAKQAVAGVGVGAVDVFDMSGTLIKRLITGSALNAPWGMAMAPSNFGAFSNALLVANFGDGRVNAYDPNSGALLGALSQSNGMPIAIDGLWGIAFGNGINSQPSNTLFFAAGPNSGMHGVYGRIDP
ncbi:MAG: TIGR03118 family protein [Paucibacter sp.]|nr:TIGR03118 family protein [Roseateles sp.]